MGRRMVLWLLGAFVLVLLFMQDLSVRDTDSPWNLPLSGVVIALDPGHGGADGGAKSKAGLKEKEVALSISLYLRDFLQEAGALVVMTREEDRDLAPEGTEGLSRRKTLDLKQRVRFVKESHAELLVSIHLNAIPSSRWRGAQTFYHPGIKKSGVAAYLIQDEIRKTLQNTNREPQKNNTVYLLKAVDIPAVLVEVGFLSNPEEAELLGQTEYQKKMANAIYQGILRYYSGEEVPEDQVGSAVQY